MKSIIIIGGGTGTSTLLCGLKKYPAHLSVVVPSWDDGGSNGRLRTELGAFPFSDARQCLVALAEGDEIVRQLFSYRFSQGSVSGHTVANLMFAALEKITGGVQEAITASEHLLRAKGEVLPVTLKPTTLVAEYQNGKKVVGEHKIDEPGKDLRLKIKDLRLKPGLQANPKVIKAIKNADLIIFGPGDLYTSIIPNVLVKGVRQALATSKSKKVFITNLMAKYGQTDGFKASDHLKEMRKYLGKTKIDAVVVNDQKPSAEWLKRYHHEHKEFVWPDISEIASLGVKVLADNLLADYAYFNQPGDKLKRSLLRHNAEKTAELVWRYV